MSLYRICHPEGPVQQTRLLDILKKSQNELLEYICNPSGPRPQYNTKKNNNNTFHRSSKAWHPFTPENEKKTTLLAWLAYRNVPLVSVDQTDPSKMHAKLAKLVHADYLNGSFPPFEGFLQFAPQHVTTDFLKNWMASNHLTNGIEPRPRSWWKSKATMQLSILRATISNGESLNKPDRAELKQLMGKKVMLDGDINALSEVLMALDASVLNKLSKAQYLGLMERLNSNAPVATREKPTKKGSIAVQNPIARDETKLNTRGFSDTVNKFTQENPLSSMLGLLLTASVLKMGVTFVTAAQKDADVLKGMVKGLTGEAIGQKAGGALSAMRNANTGALGSFAKTIKNTSVDNAAATYNIKFLTPGTVTRFMFNMAMEGNVVGVLDQLMVSSVDKMLPRPSTDAPFAKQLASRFMSDHLKSVLKAATKKL